MSDYMYRVSEKLTEVMDDIGVNERQVRERRKIAMLGEAIHNVMPDIEGCADAYKFGSQSECSTTLELDSDVDLFTSLKSVNILQCISERKPGIKNYKMLQNENISPGYCYLQFIRPDLPILVPVTLNNVDSDTIVYILRYGIDSEGSLLFKNKCMYCSQKIMDISKQNGPALTTPEKHGYSALDYVCGYSCESTPHQVIEWCRKWRKCKWPTEDVLKECRNAGCFVVPVGSKVHSPDILERELEWRISTSLQERYLMFSLNISQLMCYILMKMILKTHINPYVEDVLSSFMCKNVLFYCVANSTEDWQTGNLLLNLHLCLFMLKECVKQRNCPHFIIPENNLLVARMTDAQRDKLLAILNSMMKNDEQLLFSIQIDDLGRRLNMKLNVIPYCSNILSAHCIAVMNVINQSEDVQLLSVFISQLVLNETKHKTREIAHRLNMKENDEQLLFKLQVDDICKRLNIRLNMIPYLTEIGSSTYFFHMLFSVTLMQGIAKNLNAYINMAMLDLKHKNLESAHKVLSKMRLTLDRYRNKGDLQNTASELLIPLVSSTLGSVMACIDIDTHSSISDQAFTYLGAGKESDALSGRLKLVSVLQCTGDVQRAERELTIIQSQSNIAANVDTLCMCYRSVAIREPKLGGFYRTLNALDQGDYKKAITCNAALCTRFLQCEINCIPHELRYEILKSYLEEDRQMRTFEDSVWMDLIVVDSIPYLYFLQYKIYGQLQRRIEQQQALVNLACSIELETSLGHKDTALNLLGQCRELEDMQPEAIQCYIDSIKHRMRNNAARFLLCIHLFKLWKRTNTS